MSEYTLATPVVPEDYKYTPEQCDVEDKAAVATFRDKRRVWLSWLNTDEHHAIWQVIFSMVWHDVYFRTLAELADKNPDSGIHNSLVSEAIVTGYFATQVLSIRRLMDTRNDVISLPRLLKELRRHLRLFTRENFVAFDGLPYDYEAAQQRVLLRDLAQGRWSFWGEQWGPDAHILAARAHEQFDRLTEVRPENRRRDDRLPKRIIDTLEHWLKEDVIDEIVKWSHTFLAHAAGPTSPNRNDIAAAAPTVDKITTSIKCFVRVADAATGFILFLPRLSRDAVMQRYVRHRGGSRLLWYDEKNPTARMKPHGTFVRASKLREAYAKAVRRLEQYPDFKKRADAALEELRLTGKLPMDYREGDPINAPRWVLSAFAIAFPTSAP